MGKILGFECVGCGKEIALSGAAYACPACGGNLQVIYDYAALRRRSIRRKLLDDRDPTIWRYLDLLPVDDPRKVPKAGVGGTPLYAAPKLAAALGLERVFVKDDGRNPSASFKDRAGAVVAARALAAGERVVAAASTGNAASSLACLSADLPYRTVIFVPKAAPPAKLAQLLVFGAAVITVDGAYDDAFDLCLAACGEYGWYNRSTGYNPFTREGKKTCAFELCEQFAWEAPDLVFVPVGDGNILSGLWKGFTDFHKLGLIDRLPRLVAVQASGSDSVARAIASGGLPRRVGGRTVADSISVSLPRDGVAAVRAIRESHGFAVTVSDAEILAAIGAVARGACVFAEPAAAAAYAGLASAARRGRVRRGDRVVVLITGNGLKDAGAALKAAGRPYRIDPDMKSLKRLVAKERLA